MVISKKPTYDELMKQIPALEKAGSERKKAETALWENGEHFRTILENLPESVFIHDLNGNYLFVNDAACKATGYSRAELMKMKVMDLATDGGTVFIDHDRLWNDLHNNKSTKFETKCIRKDGSEFLGETSLNAIMLNGKPIILVIVNDITQRNLGGETLARRLKYERLISNISSEFVKLRSHEIDAGINRTLASVSSFSGADRAYVLLFRDDEEEVEQIYEWCAENVQSQIERLKGFSVAEKLPFFNKQIRNYKMIKIFDVGDLRPEARLELDYFTSQGIKSNLIMPMRMGDRLLGFVALDAVRAQKVWVDDDQSLLRVVGEIFTNVIERKRVEKEQKKLQEQLASALEMALLGPWEFDTSKDIFIFNDQFYKIFRTTANKVGGYTMSPDEYFQRFVHPDDIPMVKNQIQKGLEASEKFFEGQIEHRMIYSDGEIGHTIVRYFIIKYSQGQIIKTYGVNQDITERKRAEERLLKSEEKLARSKKMESLGLLAGGVAHDLNNVLSGIVTYPELLLLDLPEGSKYRKPIKTIKESGDKATAIVQDLLTIARGVASSKEPINLNDVVREYLTSPEFNKLKQFHPSVNIKTDFEPDLFNISGSLVHIRKVIMNLVSNASEAIEASGSVKISTKNIYIDKPLKRYEDVNIGEYAVLSISDDGSGISSDYLDRIFDPFFTKKTMGHSGTGLGLTVVWNILQDHEGYVDVISDENGTTFKLYFPITRDGISEKYLSVPIEKYKGNGETIMVVDDIASQREISCSMLNLLGYKSIAVASGEDAVEYLKENNVDLILLDMIMDPGIDGRETYDRIIKIHPKQKAVIVSGFAETDDVKQAQRLGAGQFLRKPLTLQQVGLAIQKELIHNP